MADWPAKDDEVPWKFEAVGNNVHHLRFRFPRESEEHWVLLITDPHWDNPKCDRNLLKLHLDQAVQRKAPVIIAGDLFCAMQGKYDHRSNKEDIRPEHQSGDYLDKLVDTAAEWFHPYRNNIVTLGYGNHETGIMKHHETDLLDRLAYKLRGDGGITRTGGYGGWVRFGFKYATRYGSFDLYYHHGFGGGGPVTRGKIDFSRYMMQVRADIYLAGHVHYSQHETFIQADLSANGVVRRRPVDLVRCSTYKEEYQDGGHGFHVEHGRGPRPLGGYWMRVYQGKAKSIPHRQFITTDHL